MIGRGAIFATGVAILALLAACGGGGGSDSESAEAVAKDPIDKWLGSLKIPCAKSSDVTDIDTGVAVYEQTTILINSKLSATKSSATVTTTFHSTADCSGNARYTLTRQGADAFINVDASATIGGKLADKVTMSEPPSFPGFSFGTALVLNGLRFPASSFNTQKPVLSKDVIALESNGTVLSGDFDKPLDAQGYPTVLKDLGIKKISQ